MTRSQTKKLKPIEENLDEDDIETILMNTIPTNAQLTTITPKSALSKHYLSTGHSFKPNDFHILLVDQHRYRLLIKESLMIKQKNPALNSTERSLPLYIYPDAILNTNQNHTKTPPHKSRRPLGE